MISITANDEAHRIAQGTTLTAFLAAHGQAPERVLVECNGIALTRSEAKAKTLEEGDKLEIVRIVAGG